MTDKPFSTEVSCYLADWDLMPDGALITTRSSWLVPVRSGTEIAMLKVARTSDEEAGFRLMSWWDGDGAARVLRAAPDAILLEKSAGPGNLTALAHSGDDEAACRIICRTAVKLHAPRQKAPPELHSLDHWFLPLFEMATSHNILATAADIARELLGEPQDVCPLHGDLHHENVMDFGERGWLAIDPHGLIGERGFDYANIFTNPDLGDPTRPLATLPGRLEARLAVVTAEAGLEPIRMLKWIAAWTGLSAAWFMEDGDEVGARIDLDVNAIVVGLLG